ncbi:MAG TPA: hypothetical protein PLB52_01770 [Candidatus Moranbacteria bacterium]|nr:hypothetical protein [Candidatus Moranbacteria bacterium]
MDTIKNKKIFAKIILTGTTAVAIVASFAVKTIWAATTSSTSCETIGGVCIPTGTGLSSATVSDILSNIVSWLLGIFTAIAIIAFIISGIQYLVSTGDDEVIKRAKENMKYSILGVIIGLSGFVIIQAISYALGATSTTF